MRLLLESNYSEAERAAIYSHQDLDENLAKALADPKIKCIYIHALSFLYCLLQV